MNGGPESPFTTNPYDGSFSATYTQSLLRGFGRDATESRLIVARKSAQAADLGFQKAIIDLVASTESLYWDVVFAQRNLENKQQALALAQKQLKENQIRVQVGTLAPIEVTSSEASVAQRNRTSSPPTPSSRTPRTPSSAPSTPSSERPAGLEPADAPSIRPLDLDEAAAEKLALANRIELKTARLDLESKQALETAANNRTLPQLDAYATYNGNAASQIPSEGLSAVNKDLTKGAYPGYTVGLQFSMPIQNRAAKGNLAQARANRRAAASCPCATWSWASRWRSARPSATSMPPAKGVAAAEKTRMFREKDLEAEQKKFENGHEHELPGASPSRTTWISAKVRGGAGPDHLRQGRDGGEKKEIRERHEHQLPGALQAERPGHRQEQRTPVPDHLRQGRHRPGEGPGAPAGSPEAGGEIEDPFLTEKRARMGPAFQMAPPRSGGAGRKVNPSAG